MSITDHFPYLRNPSVQKHDTLSGRETVEQFLARGGEIQRIPPGVLGWKEPARTSDKEMRRLKKERDHRAAALAGRFSDAPDR